MHARRLILATLVSLSSLAAGLSPAALAAETCPNAVSRQGPSAALPDCRAYEQLTPVDKGDATDLFSRGTGETLENPDRGYASADGDSFLLNAAFANFANGVSGRNTYIFSRGAGGWTTTPVVPPGLGVQSLEPAVFSPADGFAEVGVMDAIGSQTLSFAGDESARRRAALIGPPAGPFTTLSAEQFSFEEPDPNTKLVGASSDLSHVVLEGRNHELASGDTSQDSESSALYEAFDGRLRLVNVTSSGSLVSQCGAMLGQGTVVPGGTHDAVSGDGAKIFFTAPDPEAEGKGTGCWESSATPQVDPPQLYMRENGSRTVEISAPAPGVTIGTIANPLLPAVYAGASTNGANVFFESETALTADDKTHAPELYDYNTETATLTRVTRGESGEAEGNLDFVAAISSAEGAEGTQVYFAAFGELAAGAPVPGPEQVNLYRYATGTGRTTYIATIGSREYPMVKSEIISRIWYLGSAFPSKSLALATSANWYATADGQYLVFASYQPVTGYDNAAAPDGRCENLLPGGTAPELCTEVYRYDAADNAIVCVSCGPSGVHEVGDAMFARSALESPAGEPQRPVSEDGSFVFFDSSNALVAQAVSGLVHVYEWHDGAISLISSLSDPGNAYFMGSSADGSDVFFGTHAQLTQQDTDQSGDLYDARIDGGFAGLAPPACTATGCQGIPAAPPIFATPASVTFEGVGDFPPNAGKLVKAKAKPQTAAQKRAEALKACKRDRSDRQRTRCDKAARKRYGSAHKSNQTDRRGS
jgi:hypothetical protein